MFHIFHIHISLKQWKLISDNTFHKLLKANLVLERNSSSFSGAHNSLHFLIDQYLYRGIGMYIRINIPKTDFIYLKIWCISVIFCQRSLFFTHPASVYMLYYFQTSTPVHKQVEYCMSFNINQGFVNQICLTYTYFTFHPLAQWLYLASRWFIISYCLIMYRRLDFTIRALHDIFWTCHDEQVTYILHVLSARSLHIPYIYIYVYINNMPVARSKDRYYMRMTHNSWFRQGYWWVH